MKKTRYMEEQIASALRQAETGTPVADLIRHEGGIRADLLPMGKEVHGARSRSGPAAETDGGGQHSIETHCGLYDAGQGHAAGCAKQKI